MRAAVRMSILLLALLLAGLVALNLVGHHVPGSTGPDTPLDFWWASQPRTGYGWPFLTWYHLDPDPLPADLALDLGIGPPGALSRTAGEWHQDHLAVMLNLGCWGLLALPCSTPIVVAAVRRWRRACRGLCLACGYDLRASRERCPECGTPIPTPATASA